MNTICRPWLVMVVDQKDWQTDQFSLNDQFYDCFVCDESRGLLVYGYWLTETPRKLTFSCNDYTMLLIMCLNWILQLYYWDLGVFGSINKINETRLEALFITPYFLLTYELFSQLYLLWETLVTLDKVWYISILYTRIKKGDLGPHAVPCSTAS